MKEYIVIRNFKDKYTKEEYRIGKRLILDDTRAAEMNLNRTRIIHVLEDKYSEFVINNQMIHEIDYDNIISSNEELAGKIIVTPGVINGFKIKENGTLKGIDKDEITPDKNDESEIPNEITPNKNDELEIPNENIPKKNNEQQNQKNKNQKGKNK